MSKDAIINALVVGSLALIAAVVIGLGNWYVVVRYFVYGKSGSTLPFAASLFAVFATACFYVIMGPPALLYLLLLVLDPTIPVMIYTMVTRNRSKDVSKKE